MPNHVTNILTVEGEKARIEECLAAVAGTFDDGTVQHIDFDKILPMPKHIFRDNLSRDEETRRGKAHCWYGWSVDNWGTKWNAYSTQREANVIQFDTAWSMPDQVFRALAEQYPELTFTVQFADEDIGSNCGTAVYKAGEPTEFSEPEDARAFAYMVKGLSAEDDELDADNDNRQGAEVAA